MDDEEQGMRKRDGFDFFAGVLLAAAIGLIAWVLILGYFM
jgi:hypothetical protein